jgi:hypothetical protein
MTSMNYHTNIVEIQGMRGVRKAHISLSPSLNLHRLRPLRGFFARSTRDTEVCQYVFLRRGENARSDEFDSLDGCLFRCMLTNSHGYIDHLESRQGENGSTRNAG